MIDYSPGSIVSPGEVVVQMNLLGIAPLLIAANTLGVLATEGVFDFVKVSGLSIAVGELVYWDDVTNEANKTLSGNTLAGKCVRAASAGATSVLVRLTSATIIQPPSFVFLPTKDLRISSGSPTTNFDEQWLRAGRASGAANRFMLHYNVSSIPGGETVASAKVNGVSTLELTPTTPAKVKRLTTTIWDETTATWDTSDGVTPWSPANDDSPQTGPYTEVDAVAVNLPVGALLGNMNPFEIPGLAAHVQDAIDNRAGQLHLIIMTDDDSTPPGSRAEFTDREDVVTVGASPFSLTVILE